MAEIGQFTGDQMPQWINWPRVQALIRGTDYFLKRLRMGCRGLNISAEIWNTFCPSSYHFPSNVFLYNSNWMSLWIYALFSTDVWEISEQNFSYDQAAFVFSTAHSARLSEVEFKSTCSPSKTHLARKAPKSCYKLRGDRETHHLWTLHRSQGYILRSAPAIFTAGFFKILNKFVTGYIL